jgi:hypothetical protein
MADGKYLIGESLREKLKSTIAKVESIPFGGPVSRIPTVIEGDGQSFAPKVFRVCTATGAWAINTDKAVTYFGVTSTPNTVSVVNKLVSLPAPKSTAASRIVNIAKDGTQWYLVSFQMATATAVFSGRTQTMTFVGTAATQRITFVGTGSTQRITFVGAGSTQTLTYAGPGAADVTVVTGVSASFNTSNCSISVSTATARIKPAGDPMTATTVSLSGMQTATTISMSGTQTATTISMSGTQTATFITNTFTATFVTLEI